MVGTWFMNQGNEMRDDMGLRSYSPIFVLCFGKVLWWPGEIKAGRVSDLVRVLRVVVHRAGQSKQVVVVMSRGDHDLEMLREPAAFITYTASNLYRPVAPSELDIVASLKGEFN